MDYFSKEKSLKQELEISYILGKDILEGESMQHLRGVSFLGVLNIAARVPEQLRFSRYEHSISVAYLTWLFCQNLRLREEISLIATLSALIHDFTHPPFSHSTEVYLQMRSGFETKHTSVLTQQKITKVLREGYNSFPVQLKKYEPDRLASQLYNLLHDREERKNYHPYIADIFDTPFCPDTFDGINRAWYALNTKEVKHRLNTKNIKYHGTIEPTSLISFISSTTNYPFIYKSAWPPSKANLIFKFHDLMRALYSDIIYSDWQSSAMVMFARALEIAYLHAKFFRVDQDETDVIEKINRNPISNKLYELILTGHSFYSVSQENPSLYKLSLEYYTKAKRQKKSYKEIKRLIESIVANKLKVNENLVFWHRFRPLIWSADNLHFKQFGKDENLWLLQWHPSEGKPSIESEIEIYYTRSL